MVFRRLASIVALGIIAYFAQLASCQDTAPPQESNAAQRDQLVAFLNLDDSKFGGVLEAKLLTQAEVDWVGREQINAVLNEKQLISSVADSLQDRVRLGVQLNADILTIVRRIPDRTNGTSNHVEIVVCETRQGLRLWHSTLDESQDHDEQATEVTKLIVETLRRPLNDNLIVVAVPPFYSEDLLYDFDYLKSTYARVLEGFLATQPRVVAVSLQEAESLAREVTLDEQGFLERSLPYYVLGTFHHRGHADARRVTLNLTVKHGNLEISRRDSGPMLPSCAAGWLRKESRHILEKFESSVEILERDAEEADQLLEQALAFKRVGNWDEFYLLVESGLLLDPDHVQLCREGVTARLEYFDKLLKASRRNPEELDRAIAVYRQAVDLYETVLRDDLPRPKQSRMPWYKSGDIGSSGRALLKQLAIANERPEFDTVSDEVRRSLLRICKFQAMGGWKNYSNYLEAAVVGLPEKEKHVCIYDFILEFKDHPEATRIAAKLSKRYFTIAILDHPEGEALISLLLTTDNERIKAAGRELQQELADHRFQPDKETVAAPPQKPRISRIKVEPVVWKENPPSRGGHRLTSINGCIPMPGQGDLIYGTMGVYVMRERGTLSQLWYGDKLNERVQAVCYDGHFVWVVVQPSSKPQAAYAVMCDPTNGRTRRITSTDGFPAADQVPTNFALGLHHSIVPIEPGRVLVAGDIGRTWVGVISAEFDGPVDFQLIHQARDLQEDPFDENSWKSSTNYFDPVWMSSFRVAGDCRALLCRGGNGGGRLYQHPLIIDVEQDRVEIVKARVPCIHPQGYVRYDTTKTAWIACGRLDNFGTHGLVRLEFPKFKPEIIHRGTPTGAVFITDGYLHVIGTEWWTARFDGRKLSDRKFSLMATDLPFKADRSFGPQAFHSELYGVTIDGYAPTDLPVLSATEETN